MSILNISPGACHPPHKVTRPEQVIELAESFMREGWGRGKPALIGYPDGNRIQLLSGSHRWAAAIAAGLKTIPVVIRPYEQIQSSWGDLDRWKEVMSEVAA